jgi:hypothetical protein
MSNHKEQVNKEFGENYIDMGDASQLEKNMDRIFKHVYDKDITEATQQELFDIADLIEKAKLFGHIDHAIALVKNDKSN